LLGSVANDRTARLWNADTGQLQCTLEGHRDDILWLAFSPDGRSLATADRGGCVKLWHVATGRELLDLRNQPTGIKRVAFSPDGKHFAYLSKDGQLRIIHVPENVTRKE
jgi:WD40 repeat protein